MGRKESPDRWIATMVTEELWQELVSLAHQKNLDVGYVAREALNMGLEPLYRDLDLLPEHPRQ